MATDWRWVSTAVALAIHREQLAKHGGAEGVRELGLLDAAMARPRNLVAYAAPDAAALAAAYAFGIARDHPFVDGNKRTALVVSELFLSINGCRLDASNMELVTVFKALAASRLEEAALASWLRGRIVLP